MKRFLLGAALLITMAGVAPASYVQIKIDLNRLNFMPDLKMLPGLGGPADPAQPPMPPDPNQPMPPVMKLPGPDDDPNGKWVTAIIEIKNVAKTPFATPFGFLYAYDHNWSTHTPNLMPISPNFPWLVLPPIESKTYSEEFFPEFNKLKNDPKIKDKNEKGRIFDNHIILAKAALGRGKLTYFHNVMKEAEKIDDKHPIVKNYARVKKALSAPLTNEDPAQSEILADLVQRGYRQTFSKLGKQKGHYCVYSLGFGDDRTTDQLIERRLKTMEETMETFYYWFAMQEKTTQPNLPKYRLNAIVACSKEEFIKHHNDWGAPPMVADGFTPRRENLIIMSAKVRLKDANYQEFNTLIDTKLADINTKLEPYKLSISRDDLLSGKIRENKATGQIAIFIAAAQTAVVCAKAMEDEAERHTVTSETVRQLLIASEMFPRNVQLPDWMIEGLGALMETPAGSIYPTVGEANWVHSISFKYLNKTRRLAEPEEVLRNVVTDYYFQTARQLTKDAQENPGNLELQKASKEAWEVARATAWSLTHYLATKGKMDYLFNYGKQLDKLPRDMDLSYDALQTSFAAGFDMKDSQDPRQLDAIKLKSAAELWFAMSERINLKPAGVQSILESNRAKKDAPPPETSVGTPGTNPPPMPNPGINPPPPMPNPGVNPPPHADSRRQSQKGRGRLSESQPRHESKPATARLCLPPPDPAAPAIPSAASAFPMKIDPITAKALDELNLG